MNDDDYGYVFIEATSNVYGASQLTRSVQLGTGTGTVTFALGKHSLTLAALKSKAAF